MGYILCMRENYDLDAITAADFQRLRENPQPYSRVAIARKIAKHIEQAEEASQEYMLACEIASYLQKDASEVVRIALAETVGGSHKAPKALIIHLVHDQHDSVAIPVLRSSPLLDDMVLEGLVNEINEASRLVAVAQRRFLSVTISALLVEKAKEPVAMALLENESAQISHASYAKMKELHKNNEVIIKNMAKRLPIPLSALDGMGVTHGMSEQENRAIRDIQSFVSVAPEDIKADIKVIRNIDIPVTEANALEYAETIVSAGQLSTNLLLIALNIGNSEMFKAFLTVHTHLPHSEVQRMCEGSADQFKILFNKSKISSSLFPLVYWTLCGMQRQLKKGIQPGTHEFVTSMVKQARDAETRGINFARTIGVPIATALEKVCR